MPTLVELPRLCRGEAGDVTAVADLRSAVGTVAAATARRLELLRQHVETVVTQPVVLYTAEDDALLQSVASFSDELHLHELQLQRTAARGGEKLQSISIATESAVRDVHTLLHELLEIVPLDGSDAAARDLPQRPNDASVAEWLRCVAGLKQRLLETRDELKLKDATIRDLGVRHERREAAFRYVKEQLQHEISLMRVAQGAAADPHGAFATLDLFLVLGDATDNKALLLKVQELVSLLSVHENGLAVKDASLLKATERIHELQRGTDVLEHKVQILADRFAAESHKLKLAVLAAERNNATLASEVLAFSRQVESAKTQAAVERARAAAAEAARDVAELQLMKLRQSQHAEKEHLYVQIAALSLKIYTEEQRARKKWSVEPDATRVELAQAIAGSRKAPHTDPETLKTLLSLAHPPDDPRLVATTAAQRQRIDVLLQDLDLWRDAAATTARSRDAALGREAELLEDNRRMQQYMAERGVPLPPFASVRERAVVIQNDAVSEAGLRQLIRTMRMEGGIGTRRLRTLTDRCRALANKVRSDAPVYLETGGVDPAMAAAEAAEDDDDDPSGDSSEELGGLAKSVSRAEEGFARVRDLVMCLINEVRRLREMATTNNIGMFNERARWQEAWDRLMKGLPPVVVSKLRIAGLDGLTSKIVAEIFGKAVAEGQEEVKALAEGERERIFAECRAVALSDFAAKEQKLAQAEKQVRRLAEERIAEATAKVADLETQLARANSQVFTKQGSSKFAPGTPTAAGGKKAVMPPGVVSEPPTSKAPKLTPKSTVLSTPVTPNEAGVLRFPTVHVAVQCELVSSDAAPPVEAAAVPAPRPAASDAGVQTIPATAPAAKPTAAVAVQWAPPVDWARSVGVETSLLPIPTPKSDTAIAAVQTDTVQQQEIPAAARGGISSDVLADALSELRTFATELTGEYSTRTPRRGFDAQGRVKERRLACVSCGQANLLGDWRPVQFATRECQVELDSLAAVQPTRPVPAMHSLGVQASTLPDALLVDVTDLRDLPPPRPYTDWPLTPPFTPHRNSRRESQIPPVLLMSADSGVRLGSPTTKPRSSRSVSAVFQPLVDAVVQTVAEMVDAEELDEFRIRLEDLQRLVERVTARAEAAEARVSGPSTPHPIDRPVFGHLPTPVRRQKTGVQMPPLVKKPRPALEPEEEVRLRHELSHKEQMLARSTSPPHPMFHHSLAHSAVRARPAQLPAESPVERRRNLTVVAASTPPPRLNTAALPQLKSLVLRRGLAKPSDRLPL
jgi:hypothetical protein